ncbi:hypothetical protein SRABI89_02498 [Pseudomonas koreensis]|nr:hypothetical protein SRABI89_02498 [Pseudomonas koreensis]
MDALRPLWDAERPGCIPTQSVGTIRGGITTYWVTGVISRIGLPLTGAPFAT